MSVSRKFWKGLAFAFPISILMWFLVIRVCFGAIYYVDTNADPGGDGTTSATTGEHCAWDTIADVNAASFSAGDSVLFNKGCTWREQLTVPSSGSDGSPITFGAYGTGDDPIISGADVFDTWTTEAQTNFASGHGAVGLWTFRNDLGFKNAYDLSGNNNNLSVSSQDQARINSGYTDIGANNTDYWEITDALQTGLDGMTDLSLYTRLNPDAVSADKCVIDKYEPTGNQRAYRLRILSTGAVNANLSPPEGTTAQNATGAAGAIVAGTEYAIIATVDSTANKIKLYVNGVQTGADAAWTGANIFNNTSNFNIGVSFVLNDAFDGKIYETAVFNKVLTGDEITALSTYGLMAGISNLYYKAYVTEPGNVIYNGSRLLEVYDKNDCTTGKWFNDTTNNRVYIYDDPTAATVEFGQRDQSILVSSKNYVTIQDLYLTGGNLYGLDASGTNIIVQRIETKNTSNVLGSTISGAGIRFSGVTNGLIDYCIASYGSTGIMVSSGANDTNTIQNCTVHHMDGDGLGAQSSGGTYVNTIVQNNVAYSNAQFPYVVGAGVGIAFSGASTSTGNIIRMNKSYGNGSAYSEGWGIAVQTADNASVYYNLSYGNYGTGIQLLGSTGSFIYNNSLYNNGLTFDKGEIGLGSSSTANTIKNNIFYQGSGFLLYSTSGSTLDNVLNYNIWYGGSATPFRWGGTNYNWADYKTNSSQDANSLNSDPLFVSIVTPDFHLQSSSPCINAGTDVSLTEDYAGKPVPFGTSLPDIGAYEFGSYISTLMGVDIDTISTFAGKDKADIATIMGGGVPEAGGACTTASDEEPINDGTTSWANTASGNSKKDIDNEKWFAQSFTIAGSGTATITEVSISCAWWTSTNDTVHVEIQGNDPGGGFEGGDCPDNSAITNGTSPSVEPPSEALAGDCDECTSFKLTFAISPTVTKGTKYWMVVKGDQANDVFYHIELTDGFAASDFVISANSGTTWTEYAYDSTFAINGCD